MSIATRLILWLCILPVVPILYVTLKNETKFKKNIAVGVTLPYEGREDPAVTARLARFKRELGWICAVLAAVVVPCLFIKDFGWAMFLWGVWILLAIVLPYVPYVLCNRDLKRLKRERGWNLYAGETVTVDTAAIPKGKWLSPWLFVPAVVLNLLPLLWKSDLWVLCLVDAVCTALFWFCYRYLYRNKSEGVDGNTQLSQALTQVRRYNWGKMWLICAYSMGALSLGMALTADWPTLSLIIAFAFCVVLVWAVLQVEFATRRVQEKLTADSGKGWYVDEDDKWIGGLVYYNPRDSRTVINSRVGTNGSMNLARPGGKALMAFTVLLLLCMPFIGFFFDAGGNKPISLEVSDTAVVASHGRTSYTVALEDIAAVELLETLPDNLVRTNGTGMDNLLKGSFRAAGIGSMKVCLDPGNGPFILIETVNGAHYLFGARDGTLTEALFEKLNG